MSARRVIFLVVGGLLLVAGLLAGSYGSKTPIPSAWDRHDSHRLCVPTLESSTPSLFPSCQAMHMCANETNLSKPQLERLKRWLQQRGCAPL